MLNNNNDRSILLDIKSLEHQVRSVSIARNATVLDLKSKIQSLFDVESIRQRLIFQGKVLKDDKNLLEYENLDDGKVIHLVTRPANAPRNPENDEPSRNNTRSSDSSPSPAGNLMTSGYAVITLDTTLADLASSSNSLFSSLLQNLYPSSGNSPGLPQQTSPFSPRSSSLSDSFQPFRTNSNNILNHTLDYISQGRRPGLDGLLDIIDNRSPPISLPLPSSVELRLSRTLAYINEIRTLLDTPTNEFETNYQPFNFRSNNISASALEMRARLNRQSSPSSQLALVVDELATLFESLVPYLRQVGRILTENRDTAAQLSEVLKTARIIQSLSVSNHFLGSILSSFESNTPAPNASSASSSAPDAPESSNAPNSTLDTSSSSSSSSSTTEESSRSHKRKRNDENDSLSSSSNKK